MSSDGTQRARSSRKLVKKRMESRRTSFEVPDRFKDGTDADEDVSAAPKGQEIFTMNQSLFSMIAKTTSQANLHTHREDPESSEEETGIAKSTRDIRGSAEKERLSIERGSASVFAPRHRRKISETRLFRALPKLRTKREMKAPMNADGTLSSDEALEGAMSSSQFLPPKPRQDSQKPRVDRTSEEQPVEMSSSQILPKENRPSSRSMRRRTDSDTKKMTKTLAERLKDIFQFDQVEEVIADYQAWLAQAVLIKGYLYITQRHICFFAYPTKTEPGRSGFIAKRGQSKFNRYWFILKGDVLAYYNSPTDLYFPRNRIDLSRAEAAYVVDKGKEQESTEFRVDTESKSYLFKADSATSALDWVQAIRKVIFRTHNEGRSVKICIPLQNVWDIEENALMNFANTIKIRVIDNDETYAMDEHFFSFLDNTQSSQDVLRMLRIMVADHDESDEQSSTTSPRVSTSVRPKHFKGSESPLRLDVAHPLQENVRATLSPHPPTDMRGSSPRLSMDSTRSSLDVRRRSMDASRAFMKAANDKGRRSFSGTRSTSIGDAHARHAEKSPLSPRPHESSPSVSTSFDRETESSAAIQSIDETDASASQILTRNDIFRNPTIQRSPSTIDPEFDRMRQSQETARSAGARNTRSGEHNVQRSKIARIPRYQNADAQDDDEDSDADNSKIRKSESSSAFQNLVQAGQYPMQKASGLIGKLHTRSKRMSKILSTETMGYYEKVSGMWAGGRKHYNLAEGLTPDDIVRGSVQEDPDAAQDAARFREHFALPQTEELQSVFFGSLQRVIPLYGKIYISDRHFCFRSMLPTTRTKLILPLKDIENVEKEHGFRLQYHGLVITIRGHEEIFFEFSKVDLRNECTVTLLRQIESARYMEGSHELNESEAISEEQAKAEHDLLQAARAGDLQKALPLIASDSDPSKMPLIFDDPLASIIDFKPSRPLNITCLTIGSRGDVQPYIALCKGLLEEGHKPKIVTHAEFENAVRDHGIDFAPIAGDPAELMRICIENGMFTVSFLREASEKFRGWIDGLLQTSWEACQGSDVLIESPSAMAGLHIAEALRIPYFRAFGMTWTRTRAYPHAFAVQDRKMGGYFNSASYSLFDTVFWKGISSQINHWRRDTLKLHGTNLNKMQPNRRPFLYFVSPHVLPPPIDWADWIRVTGYWFLDAKTDWTPPADLVEFFRKAREDRKKIVYVGFGSIIVDDPAAMTKTVVDAVLKADARCVLSKGWSDRNGKKESREEAPLPADIFQIKEAPHDWLFKQVDAAVHHGGCGTTGASLRAGIPTVIKPFFGDQYFYGMRVEDLGVGVCIKKINTTVLSRAIWEATNDQRMIVKARVLGENIRREKGVTTAIQTIYRELDRARSFVPKELEDAPKESEVVDDGNESDEDWTFVDDGELELDAARNVSGWQQMSHLENMQNASRGGGSAMALGSMVLRGANAAGSKDSR